jgi:energy-coupling factor transport system substrate-specific component
MLLYTGLVAVSSALIAGLGGWLLVRALSRTGVLSAFPAAREQPEV